MAVDHVHETEERPLAVGGPKIPTRYTHRQLATMIGSMRETVTKSFTLLQEAGAIELKRRANSQSNIPKDPASTQ